MSEKARAGGEEANLILQRVVEVLGEERDRHLVLLALQGSEHSRDGGGLIRCQGMSPGVEADLILVLRRDLPGEFDRYARLIADRELLFRRDSNVARREEELLVRQSHGWAVAETLEQDRLHVGARIVEEELGREVEEAGRLRVELEADELE